MIFEVYNEIKSIAYQNEQEAIDFCQANEGFSYREITQVAPVTATPDWAFLQDLFYISIVKDRVLIDANPNRFALVLKLLTNGYLGIATQENLLSEMQNLLAYTETEIAEINAIFETANFEIRLTQQPL
jgi:hypothetical protein